MNEERFRALADAFGGDVLRWPVAERGQAAVFRRASPDLSEEALGGAVALDAWLDLWRVESPSADLRQRILETAHHPRRFARMAWWLPSAGLAAAGVAGMICGAVLSFGASAEARDEALVSAASSDNAVQIAVGEGSRQ